MSHYERLRAMGVSEARLATLGIAPTPAPAHTEAGKQAAAEAAKQRDAQAVIDFADYTSARASNPFRAAQFRAERSASIERGRELAFKPDDNGGPEAA